MAAFFGGVVAQEIVKFTGKYSPLKQWLHYDIFETLPRTEVNRAPLNSRYDDQILVYGAPWCPDCRRLEAWLALRHVRATGIAEAAAVDRLDWRDGTMEAALTIEGRRFPDLRFALPGAYQADNAVIAYLHTSSFGRRSMLRLGYR